MVRKILGVTLSAILVAAFFASPANAHDEPLPAERAISGQVAAAIPCVNGMADVYACNKVDLLSHMPLNTIGGGSGNDIWGWTDPQTGKEYAIVGRTNGTAFVDISTPTSPIYLGNLPTATTNSSWRDMKVYANHAYIVSEAGSHGLQVFDLTRLRNVANPPVTFSADARNTSFGNAHNIAINEASGIAYVIGSSTCSGGPRMFNLSSPKSPAFVGCVSGDGYTHDTQAVIYNGPHTAHRGKEIAFSSNEDTLTIVDVTTKSNPIQLSRTGYTGRGYTHQGWLTEDHRYFLLDDETDETSRGHNTRTYVWNVTNLASPVMIGIYTGPTAASDHNLYVKGNYAYEANYRAGLRIVDLTNITNPSTMTEAAFFDVYPESNANGFAGAWSSYPYFDSGVVIVNSIQRGLFVVRPNLTAPGNNFSMSVSPTSGSVAQGGSTSATVSTTLVSGSAQTITFNASGLPSGATASFSPTSVSTGGSSTMTINTSSSTPAGTYAVTVSGTSASVSRTATFNLTVTSTSTVVWTDNFESATGWTTNPSGTDTATLGLWERGDPEQTSSGGVVTQLGTTVSGVNCLVTGRLAGSGAGSYDVDGGVTSIRSPAVTLPATGTLTLSYSWYLAHLTNSSSADYFRVSVVHNGGTTVLHTQAGAATNRAAAWAVNNANLTPYAGQSIRILIEAADASTASLVEAAVDDIRITRS